MLELKCEHELSVYVIRNCIGRRMCAHCGKMLDDRTDEKENGNADRSE